MINMSNVSSYVVTGARHVKLIIPIMVKDTGILKYTIYWMRKVWVERKTTKFISFFNLNSLSSDHGDIIKYRQLEVKVTL